MISAPCRKTETGLAPSPRSHRQFRPVKPSLHQNRAATVWHIVPHLTGIGGIGISAIPPRIPLSSQKPNKTKTGMASPPPIPVIA
jgi:hypothetical protein